MVTIRLYKIVYSCTHEWDCPLPRLVIILVFRPEQLHLLVFEREISTLVMVVNLRDWERPALVVCPGN